ncbi:hypothetical protein GCM10023219_06660 [Stakelama sediminis]|uniref:Transcriptional regulator MraZ n=1 Tax=Stakelama sediminis TaxID=463200 RepID=A0A840YV21_9SPHN|nr:MraZ protein [Stakelama sediminis]
MAERGNYFGNGLQLVDDKGRVAIPATLRATLERNCNAEPGSKIARQFIISAHSRAPCILAYDFDQGEARVREAEARAAALSEDRAVDADNMIRDAAMGADYYQYDSSGRFILSGFPRFHANIGKHALFVGAGKEIEIWDPATLLSYDGASPRLVSLCKFLLAEKGIAL